MIRRNAHALNFVSSGSHERVIQFVMSETICPKCKAVALGGRGTWSDVKPYCTVCGWNLERVKAKDQKTVKSVVRFLVAVAIVFGIASKFAPSFVSSFAFFGGLFSLFMAIAGVQAWQRLKAIQGVQPYVRVSMAVPVSSPVSTYLHDPTFDRLLATTPPRRTKLKNSARFLAAIALLVLVGFGFSTYAIIEKNNANLGTHRIVSDLYQPGIFAFVVLIVSFTLIRPLILDRSLVATGRIAMGTITKQSFTGGKHRSSNIEYEFKDAAGRTYTGSATDQARTLYEDMQTPIFYNPAKPRQSVPLVSAMYEAIDD